jgi:hypothetical protein
MFAVFESSDALHHPFLEDFLFLPVIMVTTEERSLIGELHVPNRVCSVHCTDNTSNFVSSMIAR